MAKKLYAVRLDGELLAAMEQVRDQTGVGVTEQIERAIRASMGAPTALVAPAVQTAPKTVSRRAKAPTKSVDLIELSPDLGDHDEQAPRRPQEAKPAAADICPHCDHPTRNHRPIKGSANLLCEFGSCMCRALKGKP